jgi:hypothetical protein
MKNALFNGVLLCAALVLNVFGQCEREPEAPSAPVFDGIWETYYFEHNGMDVSDQYKMSLRFNDQHKCLQTLYKPGAILTAYLPYQYVESDHVLTIGTARLRLVRYDGASMHLRYLDGAQPDGFIQPWLADFIQR